MTAAAVGTTGASGRGVSRAAVLRLVMLERRSEFLRVRGGARWVAPSFILEARARTATDSGVHDPRFGFTVTKKLGKAVVRNRIRRRLREAVRGCAGQRARAKFDYVIIARAPALTTPFGSLQDDLVLAFDRVHSQLSRKGRS